MTATPPPPARLQVVAQEFRYTLSRTTLVSGRAIVELRNAGEDAHDLVLRRSAAAARSCGRRCSPAASSTSS